MTIERSALGISLVNADVCQCGHRLEPNILLRPINEVLDSGEFNFWKPFQVFMKFRDIIEQIGRFLQQFSELLF
jgi:hypothetical protein